MQFLTHLCDAVVKGLTDRTKRQALSTGLAQMLMDPDRSQQQRFTKLQTIFANKPPSVTSINLVRATESACKRYKSHAVVPFVLMWYNREFSTFIYDDEDSAIHLKTTLRS